MGAKGRRFDSREIGIHRSGRNKADRREEGGGESPIEAGSKEERPKGEGQV